MEPQYPSVDFLRNHLSDAGGRCFVEWFNHNDQMKSLCGLSAPQKGANGLAKSHSLEVEEDAEAISYTNLKVPNQFLKTPALGFIALEKQLKVLDLSGNPAIVSTLDPLGKLLHLEELNLKDCTGFHGGMHALSKLHALKDLNMGNCKGVDGTLEPLGACKALFSVRVYYTGLSGDLKPLSKLACLENLFAMNCDLNGDFKPLALCTKMRYLKLNGVTGLEGELDFVSKMDVLKELSLCGTGLSGPLDALARCVWLESVNLNGTGVTGNLEPLRQLTELKRLELRNCPLLNGSPSPLASLPELEKLRITAEVRQLYNQMR